MSQRCFASLAASSPMHMYVILVNLRHLYLQLTLPLSEVAHVAQ
jgi:hypothetical protein